MRGKRWNYVLELPDGTRKPLLSVPKYDFNWQTYYMFTEPIEIPKGSRIHSSAWYDNSAANRANPDPGVEVRWGDLGRGGDAVHRAAAERKAALRLSFLRKRPESQQ